uniref:DUF4283 domain-containing protein n=1 Tax=Nelumbo nucifera TaxID=4432 RepID=A0A822XRU3_NELNU|nr:TPA_asm: hypothetical protein HUJ06_022968 [Nelumbo nucifera]
MEDDDILCGLSSLLVSSKMLPIQASSEDILPKEEWSRSLIIKVVTDKAIKVACLKEMLCKSWKIEDLTIMDFGSSSFMVELPTSFGCDQICEKGPWLFDNDLIVLQKTDANMQPKEYSLSKVDFWVHHRSKHILLLSLEICSSETTKQKISQALFDHITLNIRTMVTTKVSSLPKGDDKIVADPTIPPSAIDVAKLDSPSRVTSLALGPTLIQLLS